MISSFILFLCYKRALKTAGYITNGKYVSIKDWFIIAPLFIINLFSLLFSSMVITKVPVVGMILMILMGAITILLIVLLCGGNMG